MRISTKIALASVSFISLAAPAWAAEVADDGTDGDKPIIVEARRRQENVQDVPQVVNAVTGATIEKLNLRNATEITNVVPGLSLTINANGIGTSSSMRGINHDVNVSGEAGTIQYYVNDVPVSSNFVLQAMYDISQISVERGPQGTLRGRSTPSGSIDINWKKPSLTEVGASIQGSAGAGSATNVQFGIGVPIIKDGQCLGAVGVSGVKSNEDAQIAKAGIAAIGL